MIDKDILKEILKNTVLSYKDAVSNVNINTLIHCVDDNTYAKCIKKISELEKKTKELFKEICPELNLSSDYKNCSITGVTGEELMKNPYSLEDCFNETPSTPSVIIGDKDIDKLPKGATREEFDNLVISLHDFLTDTLSALPEKEKPWIESFLEDRSKYKAGNFVDAIKDTLIYDMVTRLADGELVPIPLNVYPEVENEIAKNFKNYMISYENGLCRLSVLDDLMSK